MLKIDQIEIRALAREFAAREIRPHTAHWDENRDLDPDIFVKIGELGFMGMRVPERYGGLDLDLETYLMVLEELAWGDASLALSVAIHNGPVTTLLLKHGSEEQKDRYLPLLASGSILGAFALSEVSAGSDPASMQTQAISRDGGNWILNGTKRWVTNGDRAGLIIVFAVTEDEVTRGTYKSQGGKSVGAFMVERNSNGYSVTGRDVTMGLRASQTVSVSLEDIQVTPDRVLGDPTQGLYYASQALNVGRLGVAAQSVGIAQEAFEHATKYALERHQFGQAIADFDIIQFKLADMANRIAASRSLIHTAAHTMESDSNGVDRGGAHTISAMSAMAKLTASENAVWVTDEAVQIFGGYGYMRDYPVEKLMRDAKGTEIYEGTNEIMRVVVAREILKYACGDF
jgi:alkylation response protein AidB-like acyl-CoA dehydrogenase